MSPAKHGLSNSCVLGTPHTRVVCWMQSARISDRELVRVTSFLPPRGMEALLMTAALGYMRPMPPTHKQEVDALAITTHLIRLFKGHVRPCSLPHPVGILRSGWPASLHVRGLMSYVCARYRI